MVFYPNILKTTIIIMYRKPYAESEFIVSSLYETENEYHTKCVIAL